MQPDDADYFRARAIEERWLAKEAGKSEVATIHAELASEYDAMANRLELGESVTGKVLQSACRAIP